MLVKLVQLADDNYRLVIEYTDEVGDSITFVRTVTFVDSQAEELPCGFRLIIISND